MSHHRLFAQLAFERALGMAAINALAQAIIDSDQFRVEGRDRDPLTSGFSPVSWKTSCRIAYATCWTVPASL